MLGKFVGMYDKYVTDEKGNIIVSFIIEVADRYSAKQCIASIQTALASGKERLSIEVGTYREKRSKNANNYFWQLCTKIAEKLETTKTEIYKRYIKEQGVFKQIEISGKASDTFITAWGMHGIGWIAEKVDHSNTEGFVLINAYYGSSVYNKKQMSRLVNSIVADCTDLGIETKTPDELAEILRLWEGGK